MSKIHILEGDNWSYKVAIHFDTPIGNNSVGHSWKACGLESGLTGKTSLDVGTGPSDITQAEYDSIIAGDIIEIIETIDPGLTPSNAVVEALCDIIITTWNESMACVLKYFGHKIEGT
jgi:hypothetical protein